MMMDEILPITYAEIAAEFVDKLASSFSYRYGLSKKLSCGSRAPVFLIDKAVA